MKTPLETGLGAHTPVTLEKRFLVKATMPRLTVQGIPVPLKSTLVDNYGVAYMEFRRELQPRWVRIWVELLAAYVVLIAALAGLVASDPPGPVAVAAIALVALVIGYTIAYFLHESAHCNLLPSRNLNDIVTNVLISWLFGSRIVPTVRSTSSTIELSERRWTRRPRISTRCAEGLFGLKVLRTLSRWRGVDVGLTAIESRRCSADRRL